MIYAKSFPTTSISDYRASNDMNDKIEGLEQEIARLKDKIAEVESDRDYIYDFVVRYDITLRAFDNYVRSDPMNGIAGYYCDLNQTIERVVHDVRRRGLKLYMANDHQLEMLNKTYKKVKKYNDAGREEFEQWQRDKGYI